MASHPQLKQADGAHSTAPYQRWKELSPERKVMSAVIGLAQIAMLAAAQADIARRPADKINGTKGLWRLIVFVNFVGPISYFVFGRKR